MLTACVALSLALTTSQATVTLDSLEATFKAVQKDPTNPGEPKAYAEVRTGVESLLDTDQIKSGKDFLRAAEIYQPYNWDFEQIQTEYELVLTAYALGETTGVPRLMSAWDSLQIAIGQRQRFGTMTLPESVQDERFDLDAVSPVVKQCLSNIGEALAHAKIRADSTEVQQIVDADQAVRSGNWLKMSQEQIMSMIREDRKRLARIKEIVAAGDLATANDFANAALVLQHGSVARDFAMAHELCLCAMALHDKGSATWLAAASYDRMLHACGHRQRFATQYDNEGLQKVDTRAINDTMRKALHCPDLETAKKRVPG